MPHRDRERHAAIFGLPGYEVCNCLHFERTHTVEDLA
jgi:hypothetical protein